MPVWTPVYIAIGSNLNDPALQLRRALRQLKQLPKSRFQALSQIYRSAPLGPQNQPDYLNAVALIQTTLAPAGLLDLLQQIEQQQQRTRTVRWGPRTIDLDILLFGERQIDTARLTVPHPQMRRRNFVLMPLLDISPNLVLPDGTPLSALTNSIDCKDLQAIAGAAEYLDTLDQDAPIKHMAP